MNRPSPGTGIDRGASIRARLLNLAQSSGADYNLMLVRFASERWLYRLSVCDARDRLMLKGALLFDLWFGSPHRPTRDVDFLGFGPVDAAALAATVRQVCAIDVDDGIGFEPETITIEEIRKDANYGGLRVKLVGMLGGARCPLQLDVGYGDAVTPGPEDAVYPTLLDDLAAPHLRVYPKATVVAEKVETIIDLGMVNTRLKDYFDLWILARDGVMSPEVLGRAIAATCRRRGTAIPTTMPPGLTDAFALDPTKQGQWNAFVQRNVLHVGPLEGVVQELRHFLDEPLRVARVYVIKQN